MLAYGSDLLRASGRDLQAPLCAIGSTVSWTAQPPCLAAADGFLGGLQPECETDPVTSVHYEQVAVVYHDGRSPLAQFEAWSRLIELPGSGPFRVLDLGAGTGIFTRVWPEWGASLVVGLDPSRAMLAEANRRGLPDQARLSVGRGERLPFASRTFNAAWLSAVIHHFTDPDACACELARVLRPGGRAYVRGFFRGSSQLDWLAYFPGSERAVGRFLTVEDVTAVFGRAGFSLVRVDDVREPLRPVEEVRGWITKMRHADTLLTALTDTDVAAGLAALAASGRTTLGGSLHLVTLRASQ